MSERLRNQKFQGDKYQHQLKPTKKPKRRINSSAVRAELEMAAGRIFVEHLIRVVKIFRILKDLD